MNYYAEIIKDGNGEYSVEVRDVATQGLCHQGDPRATQAEAQQHTLAALRQKAKTLHDDIRICAEQITAVAAWKPEPQ